MARISAQSVGVVSLVALAVFGAVAPGCSSVSSGSSEGPCVELGKPLRCSPDILRGTTCYRCVDDGDGGICCVCCSGG